MDLIRLISFSLIFINGIFIIIYFSVLLKNIKDDKYANFFPLLIFIGYFLTEEGRKNLKKFYISLASFILLLLIYINYIEAYVNEI